MTDVLPLKFKYRDPRNIPVTKNGTYRSRCNAAKTGQHPQGRGPRRRQGLGAIAQ